MLAADRRPRLSATDTVDSIVAQIKNQPKPLIILLGDYDVALEPTVRSLFSRAIVPAAVGSGVVIIDNGANCGCSAAVGYATRDEDHGPVRILERRMRRSAPADSHARPAARVARRQRPDCRCVLE